MLLKYILKALFKNEKMSVWRFKILSVILFANFQVILNCPKEQPLGLHWGIYNLEFLLWMSLWVQLILPSAINFNYTQENFELYPFAYLSLKKPRKTKWFSDLCKIFSFTTLSHHTKVPWTKHDDYFQPEMTPLHNINLFCIEVTMY